MGDSNRFLKTYSQGSAFSQLMQIWVDRTTGVNYVFSAYGSAGGLTPLMDREGKPVITRIPVSQE